MGTFNRRSLLAKSGLGVAAAGVLAATPKLIQSRQHTPAQQPTPALAAQKKQRTAPDTVPTVAYVRDAAKGEVVLMFGTREIVRTDPELVAYLGRCCGSTIA